MNALGAIASRCITLGLAMTLLSFTACGGSDDTPKGGGAAKRAAAIKPRAAKPRAPLPPATPEQIDVFKSSFSWDPSKGAGRDLDADAQSCIAAGAQQSGLAAMKKGIDCMVAKGWSYKAG